MSAVTHLLVPTPTIRTNRHGQLVRQPRRHRQHSRDGHGREPRGPPRGTAQAQRSSEAEDSSDAPPAAPCKTGGASSSTMAVVAKPEADSKVEQKSLNTIILKAILNTHQTMRDPSSTVWETLLVKAPSPEAESFQKKTQTFSERYGKRDEATRGPDQVSSAEGQHCRHANGTICTGLPGPEGQRGGHANSAGHFRAVGLDWNPFCRPKSATRSDSAGWTKNHSEHRVTRVTAAYSRSTRANPGGSTVELHPHPGVGRYRCSWKIS